MSYVGVVETVTELKDPVGKVSYVWDVKGGTKSTASPFVKTKGTAMEVWLAQTCSYTDEYGNEATAEPKAKVRLTVERDTVWTRALDELKTLAEKTKGADDGQSASQKFGSALQDVNVEWSYETGGEAVLAGKTIPMPYYSLSPVKLKDVSVKKLSDDTQTINGKFFDLYEVTATFSQQAVARNVTTGDSEVETEYVVSYIGAVEIYLVNVEYYPSGEWVDPHDNMYLAYYAKVERYRTYSNGKRIGPDEFYDYGHFVDMGVGVEHGLGKYGAGTDSWVIYYPWTMTNVGDSIYTRTESCQLAQLGTIDYSKYHDGYAGHTLGDWAAYRPSRLGDESLSICKEFDNPNYPADTRHTGWYYFPFYYRYNYGTIWTPPGLPPHWGLYSIGNGLNITFEFYDQFLVIDGRRINFSKLHNLKTDYSFSETDFSDSDKKGKIAKLEARIKYLGKNFYGVSTDTFYVAK